MAQLPDSAGLVATAVFVTAAFFGLASFLGLSLDRFLSRSDKERLQECRAYLDSCEDDYNHCQQTLDDVCDYLPDDGRDAYSYCP